MKKTLLKVLSLSLVLTMLMLSFPAPASAATQASNYLTGYRVYCTDEGNGKITSWYSVIGTATMDQIGATVILVRESTDGVNWHNVKTFNSTTSPSMLASNRISYIHGETYSGISGRYYYAVITIYARSGTGYDTRSVSTSVIRLS